MTALAKRYAHAAVQAAEEQGGPARVDALLLDLRALVRARAESPALRELLHNPALRTQRQAALSRVLAAMQLEQAPSRLVLVLAENDRLSALDSVVDEIEALADERAGRMRAQVFTAIPLHPEQEQRLSRALAKRFGKPVVLMVTVDPSIIGGLLCKVGDTTLDSTVRHHLNEMRERLLR